MDQYEETHLRLRGAPSQRTNASYALSRRWCGVGAALLKTGADRNEAGDIDATDSLRARQRAALRRVV